MEKLQSRLEQIKNDLAEMYWKDQNMRNSHFSSGGDQVEWDDSLDKKNTESLKLIVEEIGWPTVSLVGSEASMQAWLLVQHADHDPEFQVYCLGLMKKQSDGEVAKKNIAYLEDRVKVGNGEPQLYGTQFHTGKSGKLEPRPIENPKQLEERRSQMELGTFESYLTMMHEAYGNEDGDRESA